MSAFLSDTNRRIIPRWRDFRITLATGELDGVEIAAPRQLNARSYFDAKIADWVAHRSLETAAEVVAAAVVIGREAEATEAATFVLESKRTATPAVEALARIALSPSSDKTSGAASLETADPAINQELARQRVHALRVSANEASRNSFLWVDLARAYSALGQPQQAVRAMGIALKLTPTNRFVLRSAARLFVHIDEPDRAHELLRRNEATREDPWLLASEIAVASVAERTPFFVRSARQLLDSASHAAAQTTELASALGTLELPSGSTRSARRLFRRSLSEPTENAVAQASWAARQDPGVVIEAAHLQTPRSFEARAWKDLASAQWRLSIENCRLWLYDEPFSSRPAQMGSYIASVAEEDFRLAETFARAGLQANPDDPMLVNNLVFALANEGRLDEASELFAEISRPGSTRSLEGTLLATEGLLRFRTGELKAGRELYVEAVRHFEDQRLRALAALHLAREEMLSGSGEAAGMLKFAEATSGDASSPEVMAMLERLRKRLK
jgi:tetratricopeptide (TPR) repeat protein